MRRKARWMPVVLVVIMTMIVAACGAQNGKQNGAGSGTGNEGGGSTATPPAQVEKLRITWHGAQARHDVTLKALDLYSEKNPHITFEPEYMSPETYFTSMAAQAAANNLPDILQMDTANIQDYALRGQLADLSSGLNLDEVDTGLLNVGTIDGKLYGIPIGATAVGLTYNKKALEDLGITIPENGFSWDEWISMAREYKPKLESGKYVIEDFSISSGPQQSDKYEMYQLSKGKGYLHTSDGQFNIDRDTYIEFNQLFDTLRKEGVVPPPDVSVSQKQFDPMLDNLLNGTIMMVRNYASSFVGYDNVHPGQYDMMVAPYGEHSGSFVMPAQFFSVSANSKVTDEAKKFIEWFINDEEAGLTLGLSRGPIVNQRVAEALLPSLQDVEKSQITMVNRSVQGSEPFSSRPKGYGAWTDEWTKISQAVGFGQTTPEAAYDELKKKWDEMIES